MNFTLKAILLPNIVEKWVKNPINLQPKFKKCDLYHFTNLFNLFYSNNALAKSSAERGNSNYKHMADSSTPLNRAFFVRNLRTSKENINPRYWGCFSLYGGAYWERFALCCFPCVAVFHPDTHYRQAWKLAVVLSKKHMELLAMIYQFLGISRQHYNQNKAEQIRIIADNETQARAFLARDYVLIPLGRLPNTAKNNRTLEIKGGIYA